MEAIVNNELSVYKSEVTMKIRDKITRIQEESDYKNRIVVAWIPGKGIQGNEDADDIAKEATLDEELMDIRVKVPLGDWKCIIEEREWDRTTEQVERTGRVKGRTYFQNMFRKEKRKPWFHGLEEERGFVTTVNRMKANHINVKESLQRKGYIEEANCDCVENLDHLIFRCGRHVESRDVM